MLITLMTKQLVPPIEPLITIPITAWMEALEGSHDGEVFLEMPGKIGIAPECSVTPIIGAEEAASCSPDCQHL